jgi:hypothetical protein
MGCPRSWNEPRSIRERIGIRVYNGGAGDDHYPKDTPMTASMTGFARHSIDSGGQSLVWEIRSVNHRHLDLRIQVPDSLRVLETELRALLQQSLGRGRVDAVLRVETDPAVDEREGSDQDPARDRPDDGQRGAGSGAGRADVARHPAA